MITSYMLLIRILSALCRIILLTGFSSKTVALFDFSTRCFAFGSRCIVDGITIVARMATMIIMINSSIRVKPLRIKPLTRSWYVCWFGWFSRLSCFGGFGCLKSSRCYRRHRSRWNYGRFWCWL